VWKIAPVSKRCFAGIRCAPQNFQREAKAKSGAYLNIPSYGRLLPKSANASRCKVRQHEHVALRRKERHTRDVPTPNFLERSTHIIMFQASAERSPRGGLFKRRTRPNPRPLTPLTPLRPFETQLLHNEFAASHWMFHSFCELAPRASLRNNRTHSKLPNKVAQRRLQLQPKEYTFDFDCLAHQN
jgi:hypothetical protein